jgi:hypothetical protein
VEPALARSFWLPTARTFALTGSARISPLIPDDMIDRLVGRPGSDHTGIVAYSLGRLPGDLRAGAIATLDDDPSTLWEPGFGATHQAGQWLQYQLRRPVTFDHLDLQIAADGQHSVPTQLTVATDSGSATVTLPTLADSSVPGSVVDVPVSFPTLTGQSIRITVDAVRIENTPNYYSQTPIAMPIGIAEVGIPGLHAAPVPATIPSSCRGDLLYIDGNPVWVSVSGSTATALDRQPLTVSLCGPDAGGVALGPGAHTLEAVAGQTSGFDIDQLALDSAPGGGAMPLASPTTLAAPPVTPSPTVDVLHQTSTSIRLAVEGVGGADRAPLNLVLGESINAGWHATVVGGASLGTPVLMDGFANGWRLDPSTLPPSAVHDGTITVVLSWAPQRQVDLALVVSALAIVACVVLAVVDPRRRRGGRRRRGRRGAHARGVAAGHDGVTAPEAPTGPVASADTGTDTDAGPGPATRTDVDAGTGDTPRLVVPFGREAPRAAVWVALLTGAVAGGVAAVIASPVVGLAVGVASALVLLVPRLRILLGLAAIAGIVAAGQYTAATQAAQHVLPNGSWPLSFQRAADYAWAGVVFLGADAVVEVALRRRRRTKADPTPDPITTPTPDNQEP